MHHSHCPEEHDHDWHDGGHCCHEHHHSCHGDGEEHGNLEECCPEAEFFMLAKKAWKNLMVDKIKAEMDRMEGARMDRLAKLIAETKMKKWQAKMETMRIKGEFRDQLKEMMHHK